MFSLLVFLSSDNPFNETCECVIIGGGGGSSHPPSAGSHGAWW